MRKDVEEKIKKIDKEEYGLINKSELARRLGCNRRTVNKYLNSNTGEIKDVKKKST